MQIFKFIVPGHKFVPLKSDPTIAYKGCVAVAVAETETQAKELITAFARADGMDMRWLEVATVITFPIDIPAPITATMV